MPKLQFIPTEKLLEMKANNEKFKLVDVLQEEEFKDGHIPGAVNLPLSRLENLAKEHLKKTDTIVVYCGSYQCQASTNAARALLGMGFRKTLDYKAGKKGWLHVGFELEK